MPAYARKTPLILSVASLLVLPALTSLVTTGGMPPGFGIFPPQQSPNVPGFHPLALLIASAIAGLISAFLLFPRRFGFKPAPSAPVRVEPTIQRRFPAWFWPGAVMCIISWIAMWGQFAALGSLIHYTFVPLWWGFILAIDGLVYRRTGGRSLIAKYPLRMVAIAISSSTGWYLFEYLDYFVLSNWYYPHNDIFSSAGYLVWFGLAYTTVLPSIFEWYNLLMTFDGLRNRYAYGPKLAPSRRAWWIALAVGALSLIALVIWPFYTFFMLWICPLLILTATLALSGYWTPLTPISRGDWSMVVLVGLACLINYFIGEMWNYWSPPNNPNYWKYDVPFVNVLHVFEMPALGFFGYLPFGVMCWVWWLYTAYGFGLSPYIDVVSVGDETQELSMSREAGRQRQRAGERRSGDQPHPGAQPHR